jgi:hypothetical protein
MNHPVTINYLIPSPVHIKDTQETMVDERDETTFTFGV